MFGSRKRENLWQACRVTAYLAGRGDCPICNLCDTPVTADQDWHESHLPWRGAPAHLRSVGIAHKDCNLLHGRTVVVPAFAKADRINDRRLGLKGPGLGRHPMRAGRLSRVTKTMRRGVQPRLSIAERHAAFLARRAIVPLEVSSPPLAEL
jgi:hypothetical protein